MKKIICSLFLIGIIASQALAYPITPRPLRKLIIESEFIAVAHVHDITQRKQKKNDFNGAFFAVLNIRQILQGDLIDKVIKVRYNPGLICPAPPYFEKNTDVLVFLVKEGNDYYVHALSYGVKTLKPEAMEVYVTRIREMQNILAIKDTDEQFIQTTDWLVKCAEHPATRHEGVYELSRTSDFMSFYDRSESEPFQFALNEDQKIRLEKALFATPSIGFSELGLIDLVFSRNSVQVYELLKTRLETLDEEDYWMGGELISRLLHYKSNEQLMKLAEEFESKMFDYNTKKSDLKKIMVAFVQEIEQ